MVTGLDLFRKEFADFHDNFVIIGGTACQLNLEQTFVEPRETVDIDIILVVDNVNPDFGAKFWSFIKAGQYQNNQRKRDEGKEPVPELFRFLKPKANGYPFQIEILSIQPDVITVPDGFYLTPIPVGEDIPSLSAIIMDKDFYNFTLQHSLILDGLRVADPIALICLKTAAYVNLCRDRESGKEMVQSHHIRKHRDDVFKLISAYATADSSIDLPTGVLTKVEEFINRQQSQRNDPNYLKSMKSVLGLDPEDIDTYIDLLKSYFSL